ncbi:LysM peptidoglycan-binding domain-containing protein [Bacillus timonensis]|uniref:LysM peptidoglycan-binding domain-containing protein n=1 Tax=Bacillus timonensis TaxID=1033734 RepID=A0A4S3PQJ5_9BACI|nr:polysaccharide deacetylase family protein [Bacillus timonensis]THE11022.1 LysM peptidoglycan-binding domain-containing protein [Bacillus timonensis]
MMKKVSISILFIIAVLILAWLLMFDKSDNVGLNKLQSSVFSMEKAQKDQKDQKEESNGNPNMHEVKEGETLFIIASNLGISESELKHANPQIAPPYTIFPGQAINLPIKNQGAFMGDTDSSEKRIALTFDDGPENMYTPKVLEILKEKNVKATFFVIGKRVEEYPEQLKQIHQEGHAIGNHTWEHPHITRLTDEQLNQTVHFTSEQIEILTGETTKLFRPPFGEIENRQIELLKDEGYLTIQWSADTKDWSGVSAEKIVSNVKETVTPGGIVLMHNYHAEGPFETVEALPKIIDELRAQGYEFVTVPELLGEKN